MGYGLHEYRFKENPEEKRFAETWSKEDILKYILLPGGVDQHFPVEPSERDKVVAATVIQWLGTPVGQCFLAELGYRKRGKSP